MFIVSMRINAHDAYDSALQYVVPLPMQTSCDGNKAGGPQRNHSFDGGR